MAGSKLEGETKRGGALGVNIFFIIIILHNFSNVRTDVTKNNIFFNFFLYTLVTCDLFLIFFY